jgi:hypothetical protein
MKRQVHFLFLEVVNDQRGQVLAWTAFMVFLFIGMSALVIDVGNTFLCYRALQSSCDAAALAGAQTLPSTTASAVATTYSSVSGSKNTYSLLQNVAMASGYPLVRCSTTLQTQGVACSAPANGNMIQVVQTATVPTYFARVFGVKSIAIKASSTASMRGSYSVPYNIALIVDTTKSMQDTDSDSQCSSSRIACALAGVQTFLQNLAPCAASETTCGSATGGNVANSVDRISLFTFPNMTQSTVSNDSNCSGTNPTPAVYTFPTAGASSYSPASTIATYQVVNFSSDYKTSDSTSALAGSSAVVDAAGGKSGCTAMQAEGGEGTYYAGAIYAAQAALVAEQTANPGSQNALILISDGDATSTSSQLGSSATNNGTYPSYVDECSQAIVAAQAATAAGTKVYTVAYGAEASGCATDTSGTYKGYTPCQVMQAMASAPQYFFSDYTQSGSGIDSSCISASQPTSNLNQIFTDIASDFTVARLVPDNLP